MGLVRFRHHDIFTVKVERPDLVVKHTVEHGGYLCAFSIRQRFYAPCPGKLLPRFLVCNLLVSAKHIRQDPHITRTLNIVLSSKRINTCTFSAYISQEHLQVRTGLDIVCTGDVFGNSKGIKKRHFFSRAKGPCKLPDFIRRQSAYAGRTLWRVFTHRLFKLFKSFGIFAYKFPVMPAVFDNLKHHRIKKRYVGTYLMPVMSGCPSRKVYLSGVCHYKPVPLFYGPFHAIGYNRMGFRGIGADYKNNRAVFDLTY